MSAQSLLPKNAGSFADSSYWRQFFKRRGEKVFEWYGSYAEIGSSLEKYLKPMDCVLQIGCGNSTLADDLYDNGFKRVTSVDIVEDVIVRQRQKNATARPELLFHVADVTHSSQDDQSPLKSSGYQAIVDKGTLDALLPPDFDQKRETGVKAMFGEVDRLLVVGGRYLVVTLAQPDVIRLWLLNFQCRAYILRVHQLARMDEGSGDWKLPTFVLVATKLKPFEGRPFIQVYEFLGPTQNSVPCRMKSGDELLEAVKSAQEYAIFCSKARKMKPNEELQIEFHGSNLSLGPRYRIDLTSGDIPTRKRAHEYAVFVVPQGREHEWLFSTPKGRHELCTQAKSQRLAVVSLGRDHDFPNLDAIKKELNECVMDFAPVDLHKSKQHVPYLSVGDDVGQRKVLIRGESEFSGPFVVEEVTYGQGNDAVAMRRLIFLKSQNLIQSEAKLRHQSNKIDWSVLCCAHHRIMLSTLAVKKEKTSVCLLGLGGGCLATFIWKHFPLVSLATVELDPAIVNVASKYFEFPNSNSDHRVNCIVGDGMDFIRRTSKSGDTHFDVILLDVAGPSHSDGISCPLPCFIEDECLDSLLKMLNPNGVLALNLVTRDDGKRLEVQTRIKRHFPNLYRQGVSEELNEVLLCFGKDHQPDSMKEFEKDLRSLYDKLSKACEWPRDNEKMKSGSVQDILERLANLEL